MDTEEEAYDMLDVLAFNCNALTEKLLDDNPSDHEQTILEYIKKADDLHKTINDFKEGMSLILYKI